MPVDFAAVARSVRAVPGVRACLLLTRDGLALGSEPAADEDRTMALWARMATVGELERGFMSVSGETVVFCTRGQFGAVATADPSARPGLILTHLEHALLAVEEMRSHVREQLRSSSEPPGPESTAAPRFRAPLHREKVADPAHPPGNARRDPRTQPDVEVVAPRSEPVKPRVPRPPDPDKDDVWEIDLVQLAREFGALYDPQDATQDQT